ncbi:MAG TPA: septal ring lytic transglycosylase RlpA family protein [Chitinophagaceae bacterium]|nr:septal ring lytic transglycosylase RlpA family protein [Chitinophagaceae bacterium]
MKNKAFFCLGFAVLFLFNSCAPLKKQEGIASYYHDKYQGKAMANGEKFSQKRKNAAHPDLPFGTKVKVKNLKNGKTTKVIIKDRGPFVEGRIIDLSRKSAKKLDMIQDGIVPVKIKYRKAKNK